MVRDKDGKNLRSLLPAEEARLLGFRGRHLEPTAKAVVPPLVKDTQRCQTGNSWAVVLVARLLCGWVECEPVYEYDRTKKLWEAWHNIEKEDAKRPTTKDTWGKQFGGKAAESVGHLPSSVSDLTASHRLIYALLRKVDHRGTDLRMDTGYAFRPQFVQRAAIPLDYWVWEPVASYKWRNTDMHINVLELTAYLDHLKGRAMNPDNHHTRFLALLDSQAAIGVLAKGRSSAITLNSLLHRVAGVTLGCGFAPIFGWIRSQSNPADGPSRWRQPPQPT